MFTLMIAGMMTVVTLTRESLRFLAPQTKDLAKTAGCDITSADCRGVTIGNPIFRYKDLKQELS
jgi:hypothetical protein